MFENFKCSTCGRDMRRDFALLENKDMWMLIGGVFVAYMCGYRIKHLCGDCQTFTMQAALEATERVN